MCRLSRQWHPCPTTDIGPAGLAFCADASSNEIDNIGQRWGRSPHVFWITHSVGGCNQAMSLHRLLCSDRSAVLLTVLIRWRVIGLRSGCHQTVPCTITYGQPANKSTATCPPEVVQTYAISAHLRWYMVSQMTMHYLPFTMYAFAKATCAANRSLYKWTPCGSFPQPHLNSFSISSQFLTHELSRNAFIKSQDPERGFAGPLDGRCRWNTEQD